VYLTVREDQITEDGHEHLAETDVTPFHGYSKNGTATGQLVYAFVSFFKLSHFSRQN